jgi:hypothetical protein
LVAPTPPSLLPARHCGRIGWLVLSKRQATLRSRVRFLVPYSPPPLIILSSRGPSTHEPIPQVHKLLNSS